MHWLLSWWTLLVVVYAVLLATIVFPTIGPNWMTQALTWLLQWRLKKKPDVDPVLLECFGALMEMPGRDRDNVIKIMKKTREHGSWPRTLWTPEQNESVTIFTAKLKHRGIEPLRNLGESDSD